MNALTKPGEYQATVATTPMAEHWATPRATISNRGDDVVVELEMPGVHRDRIEVTVERDELTVSGTRATNAYGDAQILHQERRASGYRRMFVLSETIDAGKITASYEDGVLRLTLPKADTAKPRKVEIS